MHDAITYVVLFQAAAAVELFAIAAIQALRPAARRGSRVMWIAEPLPATPDASNQDFAESYDKAA